MIANKYLVKRIIVSGCSHVWGHGFDDSLDGKNSSRKAWPSKVYRDFDCEIINLSGPGQSPAWCIEQIQNFHPKEDISALLIVFPVSSRLLLSRHVDERLSEDVAYSLNFSARKGWKSWKKTADDYYLTCHNLRIDQVNLIAYAGYLKSISLDYDFPLWISTAEAKDHDALSSAGVSLDTPTDWTTFGNQNNLPKLTDGHLGVEGHERFYQEFVQPWLIAKVFQSKSGAEQRKGI